MGNVLSCFGGMEVGRQSCKNAGLIIDNYFSCEVNKYAIQIANKNHPDIIQKGDINNWRNWDIDFSSIDLLIGWSPYQGFSFAGKQLNFNDDRSKLFFVFAEILEYIRSVNPNVKFLLENVKMKKEYQDVISQYMKIEPIEINSALVSAQNRKRIYWSNIDKLDSPEDRGILLERIVHENVEGWDYNDLIKYIVPFDKSLIILNKEVEKGKIGYFRQDSQANRVYSIHGKSVCLCGDAGGGAAKMGQYLFGCITPDRTEKRQNGQRFNDGKKFYTLTAQDKHEILIDGYIRKLTPIECERLQTLPDNYTEGVSDSQRYKMLGNGWTEGVITHIFKGLKS